MKKLKKFLAGAIALAMAMSMFTMTAFAAPNIDPGTDKAPTTGSITIHKYVKDDGKDWNPSTGKELAIPEGAAGLGGVDFTIYQIVDKRGLLDYYSGKTTSITVPTDDQLRNTISCEKNDEGNYELYGWEDATYIDTITTSSDDANKGVASKAGLELGIYLVIETNSPPSVTTPAKPFLVSIPMTINDSWEYNIHVYPKNETASSGDITLVKGAKNENGTYAELPGAKFQLEQMDDHYDYTVISETTDKSGVIHRVGSTETIGGIEYKGVLTSDSDGKVTVSDLGPGNYRFVEIATVNGYILRDNVAWYFEVKSDGSYEWKGTSGWSANDQKNNVVGEVFYENPTAYGPGGSGSYEYYVGGTPYAVNDKPDIDKGVVPKDVPRTEDNQDNLFDDAEYAKEADYSVGDEIPYKLTIQLPEFSYKVVQNGQVTFKVSDKPTNMVDNVDSIKIYLYSVNGDTTVLDSEEEYGYYNITVTDTEEGGFEIDLGGAISGITKIVITYTATLTKGAAVTTTDGNPNTATLEYSNRITAGGTNKITDQANVYSGEINVYKNDGAKGLNGVVFELYEEILGKTQDDVTDGKITVAGVEKTVVSKADAASAGLDDPDNKVYVYIDEYETADKDGNAGYIKVEGLSDGQYWLVETKTAGGYNLLEGPVDVKLNLNYSTEMTTDTTWTAISDDSGNITGYIFNKNVIGTTTKDDSQTVNGGQSFGILENVINKKGFTLPTTGGMGTFVFTFVGIAMMAAAVILFITSKKKEAK